MVSSLETTRATAKMRTQHSGKLNAHSFSAIEGW